MKINRTGNDEMRTPGFLYNHLDAIFNFTVDAACTSENSLCECGFYFDNNINGLAQSWGYNRVFCNPPYSQKDTWIRKAHDEVLNGDCPVCVMILPTLSMTTDAWHKYIHGKFYYQFSPSRYSFIDPKNGRPKDGNQSGTTVVYFIKQLPKQPAKQRIITL